MNDRVNARKAYLAESQRIEAEKRKLEMELAEKAAELERAALDAQAVRDITLAQIDDEEDELRKPDSREDSMSVTSKIRQWNSDGQQPSPPDLPGMTRRVSDNTQDGNAVLGDGYSLNRGDGLYMYSNAQNALPLNTTVVSTPVTSPHAAQMTRRQPAAAKPARQPATLPAQ